MSGRKIQLDATFVVQHVVYTGGFHSVRYEEPTLWIVMEGGRNFGEYAVAERDALLIPGDHELAFAPGEHSQVSAIVVELHGLLRDLYELLGGSSELQHLPEPMTEGLSGRIAGEWNAADRISPVMLCALIMELLVIAHRARRFRTGGSPPEWLLRAMQFIDGNCKRRIRAAVVAEHCGVSLPVLRDGFRRHLGLRFADYLRNVRLSRAEDLLSRGTPAADVALACGFYDQSHMARAFRRAERQGPLPREPRRLPSPRAGKALRIAGRDERGRKWKFSVVDVDPEGLHHPARHARDISLPAMTLHERVVGPLELEKHRHPLASLRIVFTGEMTDRVAGRPYLLRAGDVLFHPPQIVHSSTVLSDSHLLLVQFNREFTRTISRLYETTPVTTRATAEALGGIPARIERELRMLDEASPVALEGLIIELLCVAARVVRRPPVSPPAWLDEAVAYIHDNYVHRITAAGLAERFGVSEGALRNAFRAHRLGSFTTYIRGVRVAAASVLLAGEADLAEIARLCGFYDGAHLTHAFRAVKNLTPTEFRRAARALAGGEQRMSVAPWRPCPR